MKKLAIILASLFFCLSSIAQKDVTKFLGFDVDGPESEMIKNLESKGFKCSKFAGSNILYGRFNGTDVRIHIVTEKGKVSRIVVCDENTLSETDIKIRFNRLCQQFEDNGKYYLVDNYKIPKEEDISYEMSVKNKRYEALFYQLPEGQEFIDMVSSVLDDVNNKCSSQPESLTDEQKAEAKLKIFAQSSLKAVEKKPVWFMISELYGKYFITMYYDNEYNRANGEDL